MKNDIEKNTDMQIIEADAHSAGDIPAKKEKASKDVYVHEFKKPFEYEGKKYQTLIFDFGKLTGEDIESIESEMHDELDYIVLDLTVSRKFQIKMASRAACISSDAIRAMPIKEVYKITTAARDFLSS